MVTNCESCEKIYRALGFEFTFAFQPIVDLQNRRVFAYEALVRGTHGESAHTVLSRLDESNRYVFDQRARLKAIEVAAPLMRDDGTLLSINIFPNAMFDPVRCLKATLRAAKARNFLPSRIMFEWTEQEKVKDVGRLRQIARHYAAFGFTTAIDDFGSGFAGLGFLAEFVPHVIKIDRGLITGIQRDAVRQAIVEAVLTAARRMNVRLIAEGIETADELRCLREMGIDLFQGYLFARPEIEALPDVDLSRLPPDILASTPDRRGASVPLVA
ncbi:EAL domain-containing protein [Acuticoccus mangrovi]|uniref:EAL domain-containing protein n=1 Tax=Acuticoccus mangrovi TaxID=2796142 RepID=A0A934ID60_9HYPH|nr:EAL domain-containing protein [Acuticoccus mangrovi]MBJ3774378.1 EAL domain-containing protein [Acuticoccus mangrovi]